MDEEDQVLLQAYIVHHTRVQKDGPITITTSIGDCCEHCHQWFLYHDGCEQGLSCNGCGTVHCDICHASNVLVYGKSEEGWSNGCFLCKPIL